MPDEVAAATQQELTTQKCVTVARGWLGAVADAQLRSDKPSLVGGAAPTANVGFSGAEEGRIALSFDVASLIPPGAQVSSAKLTLAQTAATSLAKIDVRFLNASWSESTASWNTLGKASDPSALLVVSNLGAGVKAPLAIDLTKAVQAWLGGMPNQGIVLQPSPGSQGMTTFALSEAVPSAIPTLQVCYLPPSCGTCQFGSLLTPAVSYAPTASISMLACNCGLLNPACGLGTCVGASYCDNACSADPSCLPQCYAPTSPISLIMCGSASIDPLCNYVPCPGAIDGQCPHPPAGSEPYCTQCNPTGYDCGNDAILSDTNCDGQFDVCQLCPPGQHAVDVDADGCEECDCCPVLVCNIGESPVDSDADGCADVCTSLCPGAVSGQCLPPATYASSSYCTLGYDCGPNAILADPDCDGLYDVCMLCPTGTHAVDRDGDLCDEACDCCPAIACGGGQTPFDTDGDGCDEQCCTAFEACSCQPTGGGPYYLAETQTVTIPLYCATGLGLSGADFSVSGLPSGATYNPGTATIQWTPTLAQAGVYQLTVSSPSGESTTMQVDVADKAGTPSVPISPGNTLIALPTAAQCPTWVAPANHYTEEYGLPVAFLYPFPTSTTYAPATFVYGTHCYTVQAHLHGAFSLGFAKKSVTIKFADSDLFNDPARGFFNKKRIVMLQTFDDASHMRPRLVADVWNSMDPGHLDLQAYTAVLFQGSSSSTAAYWGTYTIIDHVSKRLLNAQGAWPILSDDFQGNLYKGEVYGDLSYPLVTSNYQVVEGVGHADLDALANFINTSSQPVFDAGIASWVDVDEYIDAWILTTFFRMDDSATHNLYHYHQVQPSSQLWRPIPWDFNFSAGQGPLTEHTPANVTEEFSVAVPGAGTSCWGYHFTNHLFDRLLTGTWLPYVKARYAAMLAGPLSKCALLDRVDAINAEISQAAVRDDAMWDASSNSHFSAWSSMTCVPSATTHVVEVPYMRQWLIDRWDYQHVLYP